MSDEYDLIGVEPKGTLLGGIEYLGQSNDFAECVDHEDPFIGCVKSVIFINSND